MTQIKNHDHDHTDEAQVIIVGAGPVGLLTALKLGQAGIDTLVIERHETLLPTTRAVVYMPVVIPVLEQLGLLDTLIGEAYLNRDGVEWRDIKGNLLAQLPIGDPDADKIDGVLQLGQKKLNDLILKELERCPTVSIRFDLNLTAIEDDPSSLLVRLTAQHRKAQGAPDIHLQAKYILGTDGANSAVRRLMNLDFEGFTYDQFKMIGTDVVYDFHDHEKMGPLNFVVHPDLWAVIAYTGQDEDEIAYDMRLGSGSPQWRIAYVEPPDLPDSKEAILKRAEMRVKDYCRGAPEKVKILRAEPYTMHQRCASQAKKGRVMLAGDALHSNNPIGGLGLTGGILDAHAYGNALIQSLSLSNPQSESITSTTTTTTTTTQSQVTAADTILTQCATSRLQAWKTTTNKLSQANMARLYGMDDETKKSRDGFFGMLNNGGEERDRVVVGVRRGLDGMV